MSLGLSREMYARSATRRGCCTTNARVRGWERGTATPQEADLGVIAQMAGRDFDFAARLFYLSTEPKRETA